MSKIMQNLILPLQEKGEDPLKDQGHPQDNDKAGRRWTDNRQKEDLKFQMEEEDARQS